MSSLPRLYAAVRNSLCDLVERFHPAVMAWCRPMHRDAQTAAEALLGVAAVAHLVCHDYGIQPMPEHEASARKAILGRGSFGQRDAAGKIIKGSGTAAAKIAALRWCEEHGFEPESDDVADAIVLCAHVRRQLAARSSRAALPY
jgi:hypothetical protein